VKPTRLREGLLYYRIGDAKDFYLEKSNGFAGIPYFQREPIQCAVLAIQEWANIKYCECFQRGLKILRRVFLK